MENILKELKELEELIIKCMKCGTCQAYCPLYQQDFMESSVARGKISLIESVYEGKIEQATKILKHLDYCIMCGRCKENCPSGVKTDEIFFKAKQVLRKIEKLPTWGKFILKFVMDKPELLARLAPLMHIGMKFGSKNVKDEIFKPLIGSFSKRNVQLFAKTPFTKQMGGLNRAKNEKMRVFFYPGCAANFLYPKWGEAVVKVLTHYGVSVYVPEVNRCCGIPAATLGEFNIYKKMVETNLQEIDSFHGEYVVTCCPTCQYGLDEMGLKATKKKSDKKFYDILIFLDEVLNVNFDISLQDTFTLHTPCHYKSDKKASLSKHLEKNFKGRYVKLDNQDCCGFGGTFNLKKYDMSKRIGLSKADEINEKGVKNLFTPCPGCAMQLTDALVEANADTIAEHPILYYAREIEKIGISKD